MIRTRGRLFWTCGVWLLALGAAGGLAESPDGGEEPRDRAGARTTAAEGTEKSDPADRDLIPEARAVLDYFRSVYGKKVISGINGLSSAEAVRRCSGKDPAIIAFDLSGWNSPTWGKTYTPVVQKTMDKAKDWAGRGGLVTLQFHWKKPGKPDGTAWVGAHGKNPPSGPLDLAAAVTPGRPEQAWVREDLKRHADYLAQLQAARIPVLWRPLHEIDGGWFWWTDKERPENTAALWRAIFDYLVRERGLHNLIWVYSAAVVCGKEAENIELRRRYYPGGDFVDLAGIDIYPNAAKGFGDFREDSYLKAYEIMRQVAPGKMIALTECAGFPDPELMLTRGPRWLYCLPWWGEGERQPAEWLKKVYAHDLVLTLDELLPAKQAEGR